MPAAGPLDKKLPLVRMIWIINLANSFVEDFDSIGSLSDLLSNFGSLEITVSPISSLQISFMRELSFGRDLEMLLTMLACLVWDI